MKELFPITFDIQKGGWVRDSNGRHVGYFDFATNKWVKVGSGQKKPDIETRIVMGTPSLGVVEDEEE